MQIRTRAWLLFLSAGSVVSGLYFALGPPARDFLYAGVGLVSVLAILVGIRLHRPSHRLPWYLFALGQLSLVVGDLLFTLYERFWDMAPFPSVADAFYLGGYPLLAAGLWALLRRRSPGRDLPSLIDGAIVATGLGMLAWAFYVTPYATGSGLSFTETAVSIAYPLADVLLLALVARLFVGPGITNAALGMIGASVLLTLAGDAIYAGEVLNGSYASGDPVDATWLVAYIGWGSAALHRSMVEVSTPVPQRPAALHGIRLALLTIPALLAPALLLVQQSTGEPLQTSVVVTGSTVLFLLVILRMAGLTQEVQRKVRELDAKGEGLHKALAARELLEQELRRQAFHDPLTNLPNRWLFMDRLEQAVARSERSNRGVAVMFLDLDDFKIVNDTVGHAAGDSLLTAVGTRLTQVLRDSDTAARFGGDEYAVLVEGIQDLEETELLAARIAGVFDEPFRIQDHEFAVRCSIGAASGEHHEGAAELMRRADVAMYVAKAQEKTPYVIFDSNLHADVLDQRELKSELKQGLQRDEFVTYFQPIIDLGRRRIVGCEAMIRWHHPRRGVLTPQGFIPLAEATGAIIELDRRVLLQACRQMAMWQRELPSAGHLWLSVNVAVADVQQANFVSDLKEVLNATGLRPQHLMIEVSERSLLRDAESTVDKLRQLRGFGVRIAVDDFGTGYSSLNHLHQLPVDTLKIDRNFISKISGGAEDSAVGRAVLRLGQTLGLKTIAEGIETEEQLAALRALGCETGQGSLFSSPLPAEGFAALVADRGIRILAGS
jgi:diguanylate cyclase